MPASARRSLYRIDRYWAVAVAVVDQLVSLGRRPLADEAMRLASLVSKSRGPDTDRWLTTPEVALAATMGSARAGVRPDRSHRRGLQGRHRVSGP
jgi:hypothetical protein